MKRFLVMLLLATLTACSIDKAPYNPLWVINNGEVTVYYHYSLDATRHRMRWGGVYPDTTLAQIKKEWLRIKEVGDHTYLRYDSPIDLLVAKLPQDTLSIFFFSVDMVTMYSWEEVRRDYKILKRYDLSIQDLQLLNYSIPYPPTEIMSNMKMCPAYGQ